MRSGGKTSPCLQHSPPVGLQCITETSLLLFTFSCECNSQVTNFWARLQHYLLFWDNGIRIFQSPGWQKALVYLLPFHRKGQRKDSAKQQCKAACCSEEAAMMNHSKYALHFLHKKSHLDPWHGHSGSLGKGGNSCQMHWIWPCS